MTNLTEQYRKGELPRNKVYYVKNDGEIFSCRLDWDNDFIHEGRIIHPEVLAKVPSYELWKAVHEQWKVLLEENTKLKTENKWYSEQLNEAVKQNDKLKELLKECKHIMSIEKDFASCHFEKDRLCKILTKINQVLGEE